MINRARIPWLLAVGFALLFAGTFLFKFTPDSALPKITQEPTPAIQQYDNTATETQPSQERTVLVTRIIDGDTIELEDGTRVRLLGIDTPESGQCASEQSTAATSGLVLNKSVELETDIQLKDRYNRTLAHIFVDGVHVNEELVKAGWATVLTIPPNVKYVDKLLKAQQGARARSLGIWADDPCPSSNSPNPSNPSASPSSDCLIKANISSSGEKIYHVQGQRYYEKTKIEESKGERWFCTEEEAVQAGWRKSKI